MDRVKDEKNIGFVNEIEGESERESKKQQSIGHFQQRRFLQNRSKKVFAKSSSLKNLLFINLSSPYILKWFSRTVVEGV